jgi:hypothetical protein
VRCATNAANVVTHRRIEQRLNKMTTEAQMQHWLLARCRRKCKFMLHALKLTIGYHISLFLTCAIFLPLPEGCTLTTNEAHGLRFCPIEIIPQDLKERNVEYNGLADDEIRHRLEMILREEEE